MVPGMHEVEHSKTAKQIMASKKQTTKKKGKQKKATKKRQSIKGDQAKKKQAVVIIHGIGEQKPMDTAWGFVKSMWVKHAAIHKSDQPSTVWSKPVKGGLSTELRRLTTGYNTSNIRTDFFEFYYQHLIKDTRLSHVFQWAKTLLLRDPDTVPKQLVPAFWLIWGLVVGAIVLIVLGVFDGETAILNLKSFLGLTFLGLAKYILTKIIGDAARYLLPMPENLEIRHQIRQTGAKMLKALSDPEQSDDYFRIIVMGHSLGSVVAYDIVQQAWLYYYQDLGDEGVRTDIGKARAELEKLLDSENIDWQQVQPKQRAYFDALQNKQDANWRIEHLITCGSPLAHADILVASDKQDLQEKIDLRELATCPPTPEKIRGKLHFSYSGRETDGTIPHHAAVFAATRWTNIYFPCEWVVKGDVIGGPVGDLFGHGIRDLSVQSDEQEGLLLHTYYWKSKYQDAGHVQAFRDVLDLTDKNIEQG